MVFRLGLVGCVRVNGRRLSVMECTLKRLLVLVLCSLCLVGVSFAGAQSTAQNDAGDADLPTRESVQALLDATGDPESKAAAVYREALALLDRRAIASERAAASRESAAAAAPLLAEIQAELQKPVEIAAPVVPEGATLPEVEQSLAQANSDLERARAEVNDLQTLAARREERLTQIPDAIAAARQRRAEITPAPAVIDPERGPLAEAQRVRSLAEIATIDAEIAALEAELAEYNARRALLPARRDRAARRVSQAEAKAAAWQTIVRDRRDAEARARAREAETQRREAARRHPVLSAFAAETERLATARTEPEGVPKRIATAEDHVKAARDAIGEIRDQYKSVRQRIEAGGLTRATGLLLRRHYLQLDEGVTNPSRLRRQLNAVRRALESAEIAKIEADDERQAAGRTDAVVADLVGEIRAAGVPESELPTLELVAQELAQSRRDLRTTLQDDAARYAGALSALRTELSMLLEAVDAYESFIRERTLWVRSIAIDNTSLISDARDAINAVSDPDAWSSVLGATRRGAGAHWTVPALAACGLALVAIVARWARRRLALCAEKVARFRTDRFMYTIRAVLLTGLLALPLGLTLIVLGRLLVMVPDQPAMGIACGEGLTAGGMMVLVLTAVKRVFCAGGLAEAHFRWSAVLVGTIRRVAHWFVPVAGVSVAVLAMSDSLGTDAVERTLGRFAFAALMVSVTLVIFLLCRPTGVLGRVLVSRGGWAERLSPVCLFVLLSIPFGLLVLPWLGYFYTARQLGERLELSLMLAGVLVLANALLMRWLFIARRRVAVEDARRRRTQAVGDRGAGEPGSEGAVPAENTPAIDEDKIDLPAISQQTQQLFRTGVVVAALLGSSAIWADVLPALRMLDRIEVFPRFGVVEAVETDRVPILEGTAGVADTTAETASGDEPGGAGDAKSGNSSGVGSGDGSGSGLSLPGMPVPSVVPSEGEVGADGPGVFMLTLADIGVSLLLLIATIIAFRNLPGLAEIAVLQRLPLDAGSRYALSTVLRYLIATVGIVLAFGAIGIGWSNVQWLAAAFTFGLAFGLQEIFANFVSGLIILAERPIRIGDTVTVGSVSGTVSRIRMRATTISDWDRKEMVIPNKNFITGDIINWTLSDPLLRLTIPVGVSYEADVRLAEKVLRQVAHEAPNVLAEPQSYVYFKGFGDSTLDFELRVFIPHVDHFVAVRHDLHMRIIEAFRAQGIEIAFPQRDLHVRSFEGLDRLTRGDSDAGPHDRGAPTSGAGGAPGSGGSR